MPYNRRGQYPTAILYNLPANQLNIPHLKKNGAARRLLRSAFIFAFFWNGLCAVPFLFCVFLERHTGRSLRIFYLRSKYR